MADYEIVLETSCDLPLELRKKFGIHEDIMRGVIYMPGRDDLLADTEWKNVSTEDYFKFVKQQAGKVRTAFPTYEEFSRVLEPILKSGKDAIVFTISSGLSGTANGFRTFADILLDSYPERRIFIVDTLKYASASGLLAIRAAQNKSAGMSFTENCSWCDENRHCLHEIGPMDDLSFLAKTGRIAAGKAFFGQLAGVQAVADFTTDGRSKPLGTVRGDKNVNKVCLNYLLQTAKDINNQIIIIAHSNREERAQLFKEQLLKVANPKEAIILSVGQICGPNIGPGLCAYFYFGDKIEPDREKENKLFEGLK